MPKIIRDLPEKLLAESMRQIEENGYQAMTIRSVAKACGVGIGTVYNYFSSKDDLIAHFMLEDWTDRMDEIRAVCAVSSDPEQIVRCMYGKLLQYIDRHRKLFNDSDAAKSFEASFRQYHHLLRDQLAAPLMDVCESRFEAEFVSEAVITWTMEGKSFEELWAEVGKIFRQTNSTLS